MSTRFFTRQSAFGQTNAAKHNYTATHKVRFCGKTQQQNKQMTHEEFKTQLLQVQQYSRLVSSKDTRYHDLNAGQGDVERNIFNYSNLSGCNRKKLIQFVREIYEEEKQAVITEFEQEIAKI